MMDIKDKLKDVADYFKQKIIDGDFEFKSCSDYVATIVVDKDYEIQLWIANDPKNNFNFYDNDFFLGGTTKFFNFTTQNERLAGWRQVKPHVDNYRNKVLKREKQKAYNKLKKELEAFK